MATNSTIVKFVEISRASFDALSTKDGNTLYVVKESNGTRKFYQGQYNLTGVDASTLQTGLNAKQNTLVSGSNIKTINGNSLLGSGNITISGGGGTPSWQVVKTVSGTFDGEVYQFTNLFSSLTAGRYLLKLSFTEDYYTGDNVTHTFRYDKVDSGTVDFYANINPTDAFEEIGYIELTTQSIGNSKNNLKIFGGNLGGPLEDTVNNPTITLYKEVY